jgi:hypothetical protein
MTDSPSSAMSAMSFSVWVVLMAAVVVVVAAASGGGGE